MNLDVEKINRLLKIIHSPKKRNFKLLILNSFTLYEQTSKEMKTIYMTKFQPKTILFSIVLVLVYSNLLNAQGWEKKYPQAFQILAPVFEGIEITSCEDGGVTMATQDFFFNDTTLMYEEVLKLTKVDQDGRLQWQYTYPNSNPIYKSPIPDAIQSTTDGGYIVSGHHDPVNGQYGEFFLRKFNHWGKQLWEQSYFANLGLSKTNSVAQTLDGGYLISSLTEGVGTSGTKAYLVKVDSIGSLEWSQAYSQNIYNVSKLLVNSDGSYTIIGSAFDSASPLLSGFVLEIGASGNFLSNRFYRASNQEECVFLDAYRTQDKGLITTGYTFGVSNIIAIKIDSAGTKDWGKKVVLPGNSSHANGIVQTADGGYMISGVKRPTDGVTLKLDDKGSLLWTRIFPNTVFKNIIRPLSGGYMFAGSADKDKHLVKLDKEGNLYTNLLEGNISKDDNFNCQVDVSEKYIFNWVLEAKGDNVYYGITDSTGHYKIDVDSGSYDLRLIPSSNMWHSCQAVQTVQVNQYDTIKMDFPVQAVGSCPYLTVDVSAPFLRRCFDNEYVVSYCNQGTELSTGTYVEIDLHPDLNFVSSTVPLHAQVGNTYTFQIGDVGINVCEEFKFVVNPNCDSTILGQTFCVEAHIYPDSTCSVSNPAWDGSITSLDVICETDSVSFTIRNTGTGDMTTPLEYLVIEDHIIFKQGQFDLDASDSIVLKYPANGSTYRLYAKQSPGHFPPTYYPTIAIEGCGLNPFGAFSTGFVTMFSENDVLDQVSMDCKEAIGSFDPNDKTAEPKGYNAEHFIAQNTDLEYHIRFQNTGTDTAFTVVVRDTISEFLDISTIQQGTSSHPYRLEVIAGNVLKYTFDDILLPDSTTNESASHGFVKFKISQDSSLALGTLIYNSAAIYFDFNEPILTNETFHEIEDNYIEVLISTDAPREEFPEVSVQVQPNPFIDHAMFVMEGAPQGEKTFELYDAMGRLLRSEPFSESDVHRFYKEDLSSGIYFYTIIQKGKLLASGKLIAGR